MLRSPICPPRPISSSCRSGTSGRRRRSAAPSRAARKPRGLASSVLPGERDDPLLRRLAFALRPRPAFPSAGRTAWASTTTSTGSGCGFPSPRQPAPGGIVHRPFRQRLRRARTTISSRLRSPSPSGERRPRRSLIISLCAVERPEVRVVGLFIETARDPERFALALEHAAERGVPVVALKVGRSPPRRRPRRLRTPRRRACRQRPRLRRLVRPLRSRPGRDARRTRRNAAAAVHGAAASGRGGLVAIGDSGGERELLIDLADRAGVPFAAISNETQGLDRRQALEPGLEAANCSTRGEQARISSRLSPMASATCSPIPEAALGLFSADGLRRLLFGDRGFADAAPAAV